MLNNIRVMRYSIMFFCILFSAAYARGQAGAPPCSTGIGGGANPQDCEPCTTSSTCWDCVDGKKVKKTGPVDGFPCHHCVDGVFTSKPFGSSVDGNPCLQCESGSPVSRVKTFAIKIDYDYMCPNFELTAEHFTVMPTSYKSNWDSESTAVPGEREARIRIDSVICDTAPFNVLAPGAEHALVPAPSTIYHPQFTVEKTRTSIWGTEYKYKYTFKDYTTFTMIQGPINFGLSAPANIGMRGVRSTTRSEELQLQLQPTNSNSQYSFTKTWEKSIETNFGSPRVAVPGMIWIVEIYQAKFHKNYTYKVYVNDAYDSEQDGSETPVSDWLPSYTLHWIKKCP